MKLRAIAGGAAILLALVLTGGSLAFVKYRAIKASEGAGVFEPSEAVQIVTASESTWYPTAKLVGSVFALESITLTNEVAGLVKEVRFESGSIVEPGQVLVVMNSATEDADLATARASVRVAESGIAVAEADTETARASLKLAINDEARLAKAVDAKAAAESELDRARADLDRAKARVTQAGASVEQRRSELDQAKARVMQLEVALTKKTLRAPFRARVGIRNVHPGQYLAEGTGLVMLAGVADQTYLDFAIPQDQVFRVKVGQVVLAKSAAFGPDPTPIQVIAIDAAVDRSTRNVRIRSVVDNPNERLRPGTFVDVEVPIGEPSKCIVVPVTAVRRASFGDHVFVVVPSEKPGEFRAKQRFIKLGEAIGETVIVLSGVTAGEELAADGSFKLREGALVMRGGPGGPQGAGGPGHAAASGSDAK